MDVPTLAAMLTRDAFAKAVCNQSTEAGVLSAFVRVDGDGAGVIYPKGYEKEVAELLYKAADRVVECIDGNASQTRQ